MNRYFIGAVLMMAAILTSRAETFSSGPARTDLIELFTSEGCSSCPPADQRMNALADNKKLWVDFVPIAFHVDYWNYLGWTDPYSSADFSARQRRYTKEWRARTSYTPCFVVNGVPARKPVSTGRIDVAGLLKVKLHGDQATVTFAPATAKGDYIAWLAPLTGKLSTQVKTGENRGRQLEHCFVARGLVNAKMEPNGKTYSTSLTIPSDARTQAVAVWISGPNSLKPIQAAGGWIESGE